MNNYLMQQLKSLLWFSNQQIKQQKIEKKTIIEHTQENNYHVQFQAVRENQLQNEYIITYGEEDDE